ncbi:hypothetical protein KD050_01140 [Psychrobacillus sp. INOP01]|uniref:hypothetical protein n=1 Tax=Psychrobacillus sp. INOP01 TaxID=2829187 RepID=UPI001BA8BC36|nr:hypothetical protein [Psychrobacillus sp. INOP01]QUG41937.1 hypothetical protein KD050_01140 [Psychrobacillus sp. INOP01]
MKKVIISIMIVLPIFVLPIAALAERLEVYLFRGNLESSTGWGYVNVETLYMQVLIIMALLYLIQLLLGYCFQVQNSYKRWFRKLNS